MAKKIGRKARMPWNVVKTDITNARKRKARARASRGWRLDERLRKGFQGHTTEVYLQWKTNKHNEEKPALEKKRNKKVIVKTRCCF